MLHDAVVSAFQDDADDVGSEERQARAPFAAPSFLADVCAKSCCRVKLRLARQSVQVKIDVGLFALCGRLRPR